MPPTVVTGARATAGTQGIANATRVIDMSDTIHLLDPNLAPLTSITQKIRRSRCISPKFEWLEDEYLPSLGTVTATLTNTASGTHTLTLDTNHGSYFRAADVLHELRSGQQLLVISVTGDVLQVRTGFGTTGGSAAINAGDSVLLIGNANEEGSLSRNVKTTQKTPQFNYTQIFRWPFASTGTVQASELYGGDDMAYQARKAGMEHKIQMERSCLFGERYEDTSGAKPRRFTGGLLNKITGNQVSAVATVSIAAMETELRDAFRYGPSRKMMFCSRPWVSYISQVAADKLQTKVMDSKFPLAINEYVSPHGTLYIVTHNLLENDVTATKKYEGYALILDLDCIFYRYLQRRDTRLRTNIQANDEDLRKDEFITEAGWQVIQAQNHRVLTSAAASG